MHIWKEEYISSILAAVSEKEIFNKIAHSARLEGFEYCSYGVSSPTPVTRPRIYMINNYPELWKKRYLEREYISDDPNVEFNSKSKLPVIWSDDLFKDSKEMWAEANSYGLRFGIAQSIFDDQGLKGSLTLSRQSNDITNIELVELRKSLPWLTAITHQGITALLQNELVPESAIHLTERERTVLRWTADGKTSSEISEILRISERTVNFHINNVISKLGTNNKLAAAVKGTVLGLLY